VQVCIYAFDLLYLNGQSLVKEPFRKRRELLRQSFNEIPGDFVFATSSDATDTDTIGEFLEESIKGLCQRLLFINEFPYLASFRQTTFQSEPDCRA